MVGGKLPNWGLDPLHGLPDHEFVWQRIHQDDRDRVRALVLEALRKKREHVVEFRIVLPEGTVRHIESTGHPLLAADGEHVEIVATYVDVTERVRAQEQSEKLRQLETDLAHMNRLSMMGELTASLAHEILHPIATARNNARAGMRFLDMIPPDLGEVKEALSCIVRDADRAKDIVGRVRDHIKKAPPRKDRLHLNDAINEVIVMVRSAIDKNKVSIRTDFMANWIPVEGDRVQLQQVVLNLILNAVEAMNSVEEGVRELSIRTEQDQTGGVLVAVRDSGPALSTSSGFSIPSTRQRPADLGWGSRSAGPSSTRMAVGCGWTLMSLETPCFGSPCRPPTWTHEDILLNGLTRYGGRGWHGDHAQVGTSITGRLPSSPCWVSPAWH